MTLATALTIISSIALTVLILATIFSKQKTSQKRYLLALLASILIWVIFIFVSNLQISPTFDLFANRLVFGLAPIFVLLFYMLVATFQPKDQISKRRAIFNKVAALLLTGTGISALSPYVVTKITYNSEKIGYDIIPGPLYIPFLIVTIGFVVVAIIRLLRLQNSLTGIARSRVRLLGFSTLMLTILIVITNVIVPRLTGSSEFASFAPLWVIVWLSLITYSVFKHRLFDIYFVLGQIVYFSLVAAILYVEFYAVYFLQLRLWGSNTSASALSFAIFFALIVAIFNYFFIQNIATRLSEFMAHFAFNPEGTLRDLSKDISSSLDLDTIIKSAKRTLDVSIKPEANGFVVLNTQKTSIDFSHFSSIEDVKGLDVKGELFLITRLWDKYSTARPYILEEIEENSDMSSTDLSELQSFMKRNRIQAIFPLNRQSDMTGLLLLSSKMNKHAYTTQDVTFLENMSDIVSVAISRALLYNEVQQFNITLQQKVNDATAELKERNRELEDLYSNLEELYQKEKDLMDIAGHELRTPASILKTNLYLLKKRLKEQYPEFKADKKTEIYLDRLVEGTERQIKLVNTFLESARIDNKRFELTVEVADFAKILNDAVAEIEPFAKDKKLKLVYNPVRKKIHVELDTTRIREVVDNLLNNAIKYTSKGYIEVRLEETDDDVKVSIKDTGIGIKEADIPLLFKKFSRVENYIGGRAGSIVRPGGTGLGLYVAKAIIDAHGGEIHVESKPEEGSTFSFTIPKKQPPSTFRVESRNGKISTMMAEKPGTIHRIAREE